MALNERICRLRTNAQLSQEAFADIFHVSRQSVQKWENGSATPELSKIIDMARYFDVSLDQLVLGMDKRAVECMEYGKIPRPQYANMPEWELYVSDILIEYQQSIEEGLDISAYQELFRAVSVLPAGDIKSGLEISCLTLSDMRIQLRTMRIRSRPNSMQFAHFASGHRLLWTPRRCRWKRKLLVHGWDASAAVCLANRLKVSAPMN